MSDPFASGPSFTPPIGGDAQPQLGILAQYVKDLSFENPGAPQSLQSGPQQPQVQINVDVGARALGGDAYEAQVLDLIGELRARLGMSVVLITHDLGVVAEQADRIVVMYAGQVVEEGPAAQVIARPLHPYTRGLLDSMPSLEDFERPIRPIPGQTPDPIRLPAHCRFLERCPLAGEACRAPVALREIEPGRSARCVRAQGGGDVEA